MSVFILIFICMCVYMQCERIEQAPLVFIIYELNIYTNIDQYVLHNLYLSEFITSHYLHVLISYTYRTDRRLAFGSYHFPYSS